jgi:hypothetical protein
MAEARRTRALQSDVLVAGVSARALSGGGGIEVEVTRLARCPFILISVSLCRAFP